MRFILTTLLLLSVSLFSYSQTKDFFKEHLFTAGIEGPSVDNNGNIYAVNFQTEGTIGQISPMGDCALYISLPQGSTGNATIVLANFDLLVADYTGHNILRIQHGTLKTDTLVHEPAMNQPNDIVRLLNGYIYASDPNWKKSTGKLWLIKDRKAILLDSTMGTTNGIESSPDDKVLYVNESVQQKVWAYDIQSDGHLTNKRLFHQFKENGMDGMKCDEKGNLYIARYGHGTVAVLSPKGKLIKEIKLKGNKPTNIAFSGKRVYVTMQDRGNIEYFENDIKGKKRF